MRTMRKYFRGSGRVLAFVFIASVIWLLFDMAALRLSINDVNSQLLKELVIKERAAVRQQGTKRTNDVNKGFKHPVQRVDLDLDNDDQSPFGVVNKVAEVYRKRPKKGPAFKDREVKAAEQGGGGSPNLHNDAKAAAAEHKDSVIAQVTSKVHVPLQTKAPAQKDVVRHVTTKPEEKKVVLNDSPKKGIVPPVASNSTKAPPGVQKEQHVAPPTSDKKPEKLIKGDVHVVQKSPENINVDSKPKDKFKDALERDKQVKDKIVVEPTVKHVKRDAKEALEARNHDNQVKDKIAVEPSVTPVKKDAKEKEVVIKTEKQMVKGDLVAVNNASLPTNNPPTAKAKLPQVKANDTAVPRKTGVHKVLPLDVTQAPRDGHAVGQYGHAAVAPSDKEEEVSRRWKEGHFNVYLSEQIPADRALPDTRPQTCSDAVVHDDLPTTSVIFCFVDEVWSTLIRSVHSVLNRSPPHLLTEIILVDDFSTKDYLKEKLDVYMSRFPKVRIVRLKEREGLIRARLAGAAIAKGEVLTFLDSHVECNVGWLEPLLERVYLDRKKVACPVIEVISDKDMSYVLVDNFQRGIFKWPLVFGWSTLSDEYIKKNNMKDTDPIRCPVMAGGLFSIDKQYFYELGAYDPGLDVWGGENMEISFKIWMCGGAIEIIPCSRVGHIFRGENPYKFPKDRQRTVERNLARVAEVWLDEYKELFYGHGYHHLLDKALVDIGNLTAQVALRDRLQCKSFRWYLDNVYPDMEAPLVKAEGLVFNRGSRKCLALQNASLSFEICDLSKQSQHFNYTWLKLLRQQDVCVAPQGQDAGPALLLPCDNAKPSLRWLHKASKSALREHLIAEHIPKHMCLEAGPQGEAGPLREAVHLVECDAASAFQKWQFTHYYAQ